MAVNRLIFLDGLLWQASRAWEANGGDAHRLPDKKGEFGELIRICRLSVPDGEHDQAVDVAPCAASKIRLFASGLADV